MDGDVKIELPDFMLGDQDIIELHWDDTRACFMKGSEVLGNHFVDIPENTTDLLIAVGADDEDSWEYPELDGSIQDPFLA